MADELQSPAVTAEDAGITHPLQALPDMQQEPSPLKDGVVWVGLMFVVSAIAALLLCRHHPELFSSFISTSGTVHLGVGGGIAGNRAWSKVPYNNAAKQPVTSTP